MKSFHRGIGLLILSALLLLSHSVSAGQHRDSTPKTPLIFVHGGAGSASQFESQAMRLTSNGYPQKLLFALEYDSSFRIDTVDAVHNRLDQLISQVQAQTGAPQVDVMGHSLGTYVLNGYRHQQPGTGSQCRPLRQSGRLFCSSRTRRSTNPGIVGRNR